MTKDKFSITELSCEIHERHPYSSERLETNFSIPKIIDALLKMIEKVKITVSFTYASDPQEHWFDYFAERQVKKDDNGNISDQGIYDLGEKMLVSHDDWVAFENGSVFQDWISDNAPPTEEQVQSSWPGTPKPEPGSLTTEARRRGGRQPKLDLSLLDAIRSVIVDVAEDGIMPTSDQVWKRLCELGQQNNRHVFEPPISGCDYMFVEGDALHFQDQEGNPKMRKRRSLDRYITEAKRVLAQTD